MNDSREKPAFTWRAAKHVRDWLEQSARKSNRSMNAQLNTIIEKAMQKESEEKKTV